MTAAEFGETSSSFNAWIEARGPAFPATTEICCNISYLREVLEALSYPQVEKVAIEWTTPVRPIVLRPVASCEAAYLIMPMTSQGQKPPPSH
nr:hypothetical protein [Thermogemmatispora sp.]